MSEVFILLDGFKSPHAVRPNGIFSNILVLGGFIGLFWGLVYFWRLFIKKRSNKPIFKTTFLHSIHHSIFSFLNLSISFYALINLISRGTTPNPLFSMLFHLAFITRVFECLDYFLEISYGRTDMGIQTESFGHAADLTLSWVLSYYSPSGTAIWFLILATLRFSIVHLSYLLNSTTLQGHARRITMTIDTFLELIIAIIALIFWKHNDTSCTTPRPVLVLDIIRDIDKLSTMGLYYLKRTPAEKVVKKQ